MGKHQITAMVAGLVLAMAASAAVRAEEAANNTNSQALTFYGVEMKRDDQITLKEFQKFARSHGQANYVLSESPLISYEGTGDVILSSYGLDKAEQEKIASEIPSKGKVLEIQVSPSALSTKRGVGLYKLPLLSTEDSNGGDVWVKAGNNAPQKVESRVVLNSNKPNVANMFKFLGFTDHEGALAYCLDDCMRYDLVNGNKTPLQKPTNVDAAGIHRSIDGLLGKEGADTCKGKMTNDTIQNAGNNGYYRGVCPTKGNQVLEVQLQKDSGRWKVINSTWEKAQTLR